MKNLIKKALTVIGCVFMLTVACQALDYSKTKTVSYSAEGGNATTYCEATYHSSGYMRWTRAWYASRYNLRDAYAYETNYYIPYDTHCETTGKTTIVTNTGSTSYKTKTFSFTYSNSAVY